MKNFAHRGCSGDYPENTMAAFEAACKTDGCDGIENDVHLTKDGEIVVIHDEKIDRTCTDGTGWIKDMTYDELKRLDFSYTYSKKTGRQRIPTLREYFDLVKSSDMETNIELKTGLLTYPGIEEKVYDLIREYGMDERIIISSFNHYSVQRFKKLAPHIRCGLLSEAWILDAGRYVKQAGAEYYHPVFTQMLDEGCLRGLREQGIGINVWTVNEPEYVMMMLKAGVDAVIGNYPARTAGVIAAYTDGART